MRDFAVLVLSFSLSTLSSLCAERSMLCGIDHLKCHVTRRSLRIGKATPLTSSWRRYRSFVSMFLALLEWDETESSDVPGCQTLKSEGNPGVHTLP